MRVRLAEFITAHVEPILAEWESFARDIWPPGAAAEPAELRDSAEEILRAVVADMGTVQSARERSEKSMGRGGSGPAGTTPQSDRLDHASQVHGAARVGSGLALPAVVAEYRALRASVLRLWRASRPDPDGHDLDDLTRFNEAIDQSLALAVDSFTHRVDAARKMFLGILGHDLRNPLSAITLTATVATADAGDRPELRQQLAQIVESATAIAELVTDLLDFTSSAMGVQLPLAPARADLHVLCDEVARETRAAHPGRTVRLQVRGDLAGTWDPHRLRQLVANLLGNALQHGSPTGPVDLAADGTDADAVVITVHNAGEAIPADVLPTIFDPLVRAPTAIQRRRTPGSIGLGLYIVREIAAAHGGTAELTSTAAGGTTATVGLPRHARK
jgi:signal transduction histidine kinase